MEAIGTVIGTYSLEIEFRVTGTTTDEDGRTFIVSRAFIAGTDTELSEVEDVLDPHDVTTAEAAVFLRVSERTIRRMIDRGDLEGRRGLRGSHKLSVRSVMEKAVQR